MFCCLPHVRADRAALLALCTDVEASSRWTDTSANGVSTPNHRTYLLSADDHARCGLATTFADIGVVPDIVNLLKVPGHARTDIHTDLGFDYNADTGPRRRATGLNITLQADIGKSLMVYVDEHDDPIAMLSTAVPVLCRVDTRHYVDNLQADIPRLIVSFGWYATYDEILPQILGRQEGIEPSTS